MSCASPQLFYWTHIAGYILVLLFGAIHYGAMVFYYLPSECIDLSL